MDEPIEPAAAITNWKLTLAYDGTDYSGWQVQPGERTIQGELQEALQRVTGENPLPQGSGRTDAGVHALGQVASFWMLAPIPPENLKRALNRTLPEAIRILDAEIAPASFHARHSAVAKTYEYRIFREPLCPPFLARYVLACTWPLDFDALQAAARMFVGEHDFLSFAATDPDLGIRSMKIEEQTDAETTGKGNLFAGRLHTISIRTINLQPSVPQKTSVRTIFSSTWERQQCEAGELLVYRVRGNGFLHHMVRNLVGTMVDVGRGRTRADEIPKMLAARARATAGPTAPARGLFLHSVEYARDSERTANPDAAA